MNSFNFMVLGSTHPNCKGSDHRYCAFYFWGEVGIAGQVSLPHFIGSEFGFYHAMFHLVNVSELQCWLCINVAASC